MPPTSSRETNTDMRFRSTLSAVDWVSTRHQSSHNKTAQDTRLLLNTGKIYSIDQNGLQCFLICTLLCPLEPCANVKAEHVMVTRCKAQLNATQESLSLILKSVVLVVHPWRAQMNIASCHTRLECENCWHCTEHKWMHNAYNDTYCCLHHVLSTHKWNERTIQACVEDQMHRKMEKKQLTLHVYSHAKETSFILVTVSEKIITEASNFMNTTVRWFTSQHVKLITLHKIARAFF